MQALWDQAAGDLYGPKENPVADPVVWEHSARVARLTATLAAMPELAHHVLDRTALTAAALYHDAGWLLDVWDDRIDPSFLLLKRTSDEQRERAAAWMRTRLADVLEPGCLRLAARIVVACNDRDTRLLEARILADAENLDLVGPQALWFMVRRQLAEQRTLDEMVDAWQRQEQYGYWPVWIKESLRFASSQQLAKQRWKAMARYMDDLRRCCAPVNDQDPARGSAADRAAPLTVSR